MVLIKIWEIRAILFRTKANARLLYIGKMWMHWMFLLIYLSIYFILKTTDVSLMHNGNILSPLIYYTIKYNCITEDYLKHICKVAGNKREIKMSRSTLELQWVFCLLWLHWGFFFYSDTFQHRRRKFISSLKLKYTDLSFGIS